MRETDQRSTALVSPSQCITNWVLLCNAQSIFYKFDELCALVSGTKPSIICITESWLTPDVSSDLLIIFGYILFRNDRQDDSSDTRRGGGTLVYVHLSLCPALVDVPFHLCKPRGIECTIVKFNDIESSLAFMLCLYVPPGLRSDSFQAVKQFIIDCLDCFLCEKPNATLYLCGDFNRYDMSFLDDHFNLTNIVSTPTFGNAVLDKFFCAEAATDTFSVTVGPFLVMQLWHTRLCSFLEMMLETTRATSSSKCMTNANLIFPLF